MKFINTDVVDCVDLRRHMSAIMYGGICGPGYGHWVVLRHYDKTKLSAYDNIYTAEGVGGPRYEYTDKLIRARRQVTRPPTSVDSVKLGELHADRFEYFIEYNEVVQIGDNIFEILYPDCEEDNTLPPVEYKLDEQYSIKRVKKYRLDSGRVEYISAIASFDGISY